jgi:hypothetical protein
LQTADPKGRARACGGALCAVCRGESRCEKITELKADLTGFQIEELFRDELESELRFHVQRAFEDDEWSDKALEMGTEDRVVYRHPTSSDRFAPELLEYAKGASPDEWIGQKLASIGASSDSRDISAARAHLFGTRAAAGSLVQRLF